MTDDSYHYIGDADGHERLPTAIAGNSFRAVRTLLFACGQCGAVVSEGTGQERHDRWHEAMPARRGGVAR